MVSLPIVLLIFMSSDSRDGVFNNKIMEILKENNLSGIISGQNFQSQANDLTPLQMKYPEEISRSRIIGDKKMTREKIIEDKSNKGKVAAPLYSLVKNDCESGYVMDENGICQKAIMARSGKTFDLERRKRFAPEPNFTKTESFINKWPFFKKYLLSLNKADWKKTDEKRLP